MSLFTICVYFYTPIDFNALCRAHVGHLNRYASKLSIAQQIYVVIDRQLGEGVRESEQLSVAVSPLPQTFSHMCIIIRAGIRSQDFTVVKLF